MILIADSGATKTDWCLGSTPTDVRIFQTQGINPFHQTKEFFAQILSEELLPQVGESSTVTAIHFYGAGCTPEKSLLVKEALQVLFPDASIDVQSDLLGAARSLCGKEPGIACILGTGSNSCEYNGEKILSNVSPLGYILGDEGSGAVLGKRLTGDCLKHQLPENICRMFLEYTGLTPAQIIDKVYRQPQANRFLASLTPFLSAHRDLPEIHQLLISCFSDFFERNVMQYNHPHWEVHFTGSISWYFQEEIKEAAQRFNLHIGKFIKSPINGLIKYHFEL